MAHAKSNTFSSRYSTQLIEMQYPSFAQVLGTLNFKINVRRANQFDFTAQKKIVFRIVVSALRPCLTFQVNFTQLLSWARKEALLKYGVSWPYFKPHTHTQWSGQYFKGAQQQQQQQQEKKTKTKVFHGNYYVLFLYDVQQNLSWILYSFL